MLYATLEHMLHNASSLDTLWADSDTPGWIQPMPSDGLQSWHNNTRSSQHLPPDPVTTSGDYGTDRAAGAWAAQQHPLGP